MVQISGSFCLEFPDRIDDSSNVGDTFHLTDPLMVRISLVETMASLFETICFMRVCGTPVALLFLAAPIVAGLAAVTVPAAVAPIAPSSSDQKQRDGEEFSNNLVSDLAPYVSRIQLDNSLLVGC